MFKEWWERLSRVEAGSSAGLLTFVVMAMSFITVIALLATWLIGHWLPLALAGLGWGSFLLFVAVHAAVLDPGSRAIVNKGSSTPYTNQHSDIQAMAARGEIAKAAEAYRQVIAADPRDLVACEQLLQLALRELKDYELALYAAREGEKRAPDARARAGFALIAVNIYRDNLKDYGRTMVELRRVVSRYPEVPNRARLSAEIDELKAMHFERQ